jgi:hypothetical protein
MKLIDLCFGKQPVDGPQKQISPQEKCQSATRFPVTRNLVSYVSAIVHSFCCRKLQKVHDCRQLAFYVVT